MNQAKPKFTHLTGRDVPRMVDLSKTKGTWSILCESKDVNASGILKWNNNDGSVNGNGKDNKGKKIKFKVASIN